MNALRSASFLAVSLIGISAATATDAPDPTEARIVTALAHSRGELLATLGETTCFTDASDPFAVGFVRRLKVTGTFANALRILENFRAESHWVPSLDRVEELSKSGTPPREWVVRFREDPGIPLAGDVQYDVRYVRSGTDESTVYRYQQVGKSSGVRSLQGWMRVERLSETEILFEEGDFLRTAAPPFGMFPGKVRQETTEGLWQSDAIFRAILEKNAEPMKSGDELERVRDAVLKRERALIATGTAKCLKGAHAF